MKYAIQLFLTWDPADVSDYHSYNSQPVWPLTVIHGTEQYFCSLWNSAAIYNTVMLTDKAKQYNLKPVPFS